jgi:hypothetical protein
LSRVTLPIKSQWTMRSKDIAPSSTDENVNRVFQQQLYHIRFAPNDHDLKISYGRSVTMHRYCILPTLDASSSFRTGRNQTDTWSYRRFETYLSRLSKMKLARKNA